MTNCIPFPNQGMLGQHLKMERHEDAQSKTRPAAQGGKGAIFGGGRPEFS